MSDDVASSEEFGLEREEAENRPALSLAFYVAALLWLVYLSSSLVQWTSWKDYRLPMLVIVAMGALTAYKIGRSVYELHLEGTTIPDVGKYRRIAFVLGWLVTLPIAIYYFGFVRVVPVYFFAFLLVSYRDVKRAIVVTAVFLVFMYVMFRVILPLSLWEGVV